jgi:hypothetical protein
MQKPNVSATDGAAGIESRELADPSRDDDH